MRSCPRCFHENEPTATECELCGAPLGSSEDAASPENMVTSILAAFNQEEGAPLRASSSAMTLVDTRSSDNLELTMREVLRHQGPVGGYDHGASLTAMGSGYRLCPHCAAANDLTALSCVRCGAGFESRMAPETSKAIDSGMFLIVIREDGKDGQRIPLNRDNIVIGRTGDIPYPNDVFLSPRHVLLQVEDDALYARDLQSLNGTYLKIREEVMLHPGDVFLMGRQVLRVQRFENEFAVRPKAADGTRFMGSPLPTGRLKIQQIGLGGLIQDVYCLSTEGATIGRETGDVLFPQDKFMSSQHARIRLGDDGEFYLSDQNSSNGSWIRIADRRELQQGDFLFVGQQLFRVDLP